MTLLLESDSNLPEDRYQFLSYLLSREALSLKDITVICLSVLTDGLSTTTPSTLFCLYALATDKRIQVSSQYINICWVIDFLTLKLD